MCMYYLNLRGKGSLIGEGSKSTRWIFVPRTFLVRGNVFVFSKIWLTLGSILWQTLAYDKAKCIQSQKCIFLSPSLSSLLEGLALHKEVERCALAILRGVESIITTIISTGTIAWAHNNVTTFWSETFRNFCRTFYENLDLKNKARCRNVTRFLFLVTPFHVATFLKVLSFFTLPLFSPRVPRGLRNTGTVWEFCSKAEKLSKGNVS